MPSYRQVAAQVVTYNLAIDLVQELHKAVKDDPRLQDHHPTDKVGWVGMER